MAKLVWAGRVVSALAAFPFVPSAGMKLVAHAQVVEGFAHLELPARLMKPLGALELACAAIYLVPATSTFGAILLTGYVGGAILTHLRIGEPVYLQAALGVLVWLGLFLREPRLRAILPLRR